MRPVIFLDCDGVINHRGSFAKRSARPAFDSSCVSRVNRIALESDSRIVISSTWRLLPDCMEQIEATGLDHERIDGVTPYLSCERSKGGVVLPGTRGREVEAWLDGVCRPDRYVILDDDNDFLGSQQRYLVKTDFEHGIQDPHVEQALEILSVEVSA